MNVYSVQQYPGMKRYCQKTLHLAMKIFHVQKININTHAQIMYYNLESEILSFVLF